ncbi:peptidase M50 [Sulfurifustis variabilis]|uniref:Peptidase M50 n=1 Tax=Sulfurifustis variabilis TaxID=1675686 RepID=A0A1B4V344_9GAMM|nr:site-2 protease family protein [Sulfurifustis variabilis]BAU47765.1 peptidase M50 [Sulfurifustis variabilis]
MFGLTLPQFIAVAVLPLLFAITVHEAAHGWAAKRLGDPTAQRLGRLTLNPIKHIDPFGTVLVPGLLLLFGGFIFGWAKPVPVTWENLRQPKRDMALVAAAGPGANLLMALLWALVAKAGALLPDTLYWAGTPMQYMGQFGILINAVLMVLNLLPLPPLDGGRVAVGLLPGRYAWQLSRVEPYGFFILLALLFIPVGGQSVLRMILAPPVTLVHRMVSGLAGL